MPSIAHPDPAAVMDTAAKFFRVMAKAGAPFEAFGLPVNNRTARRNLAAFLAAGCPKITLPDGNGEAKPATPYDLATMILGRDFISPEEIVGKYPTLAYSEEQLDMLEQTLPWQKDLEWLWDNNFILVPGPATAQSLLDVRALAANTANFCTKSGGWYAEDKQKFANNDKATTQWIALRKEAVPGSFNCTWAEQQAKLSGLELVPNAAEATWCICVYKSVRNISLFRTAYNRTSSVDSDGRRVIVGGLGPDWLGVVLGDWDGDRGGNVGLSSARKFPA